MSVPVGLSKLSYCAGRAVEPRFLYLIPQASLRLLSKIRVIAAGLAVEPQALKRFQTPYTSGESPPRVVKNSRYCAGRAVVSKAILNTQLIPASQRLLILVKNERCSD